MTTLPQTTSVRLPQSGPGGALTAHVPASGGAAPAGIQMTGADVWRVIRANLWLIILMLILAGAGGYGLFRVWAAKWPSYTAVGMLEIRTSQIVEPVKGETKEMSDTRLSIAQRTQAAILQSTPLFSEALRNRTPLRETQWFKSFKDDTRDAKEDLEKNFRVNPVPDSMLLQVRMTCSDARDSMTVVEEIVSQHLENELARASTRHNEQTRTLKTARDQYEALLKDVSGRVRDRQMILAERGMGTSGFFSAKEAELRALIEARFKMDANASEAASMYKHVKEQLGAGQTVSEVERILQMDPVLAGLQRDVMSYQIQYESQLKLRGSEDHPNVAQLKVLVDTAKQAYENLRQETRIRRTNELLGQLEGAVATTSQELKAIDDQVAALKKDHAELSREMATLLLDLEEQKGWRELKQEVLNKLQTFPDPSGQMQIGWYQHPETPDIPSSPKLWLVMSGAIVIGLGLALGIAFLRELLDETVRSPRDITRVGHINVLGIIADVDDDPQVGNARLAIFESPHSITAEQFRQVRTRLQHVAGLESTRSIMITGPSPMDGKTTVAANLAAGLALNGRKILLVDANFRRPELHRIFGLANEKGFSDVLNGSTSFEETAHATRIPNLSLMTSGPKPANPTELFESQLLVDFIERALEDFDHVVFDSGPLLVVSESVAMAPRVDGVVTVVRAHQESRGVVQRMRDLLRQVRAEHLGVVINAVRAQGGGYYRRNIKTYYDYSSDEA